MNALCMYFSKINGLCYLEVERVDIIAIRPSGPRRCSGGGACLHVSFNFYRPPFARNTYPLSRHSTVLITL